MSKISYIGGDYIEWTGGTYTEYSNKITISTNQKINITADGEKRFGDKPEAIKYESDIDKEGPGLVLRSAKKKGRNKNDTATAADLLYGDYPENAIGLNKLKQELKQEFINVEFEKKKNDTFPLIKPTDEFIRKEAEIFAQRRIDSLKPYLKKTNDELFAIFENNIKSWSRNDLEDVAVDIVGKMKKNTGGTVSYKAMTSAAKNHASFVEFATITENCIREYTYKKNKINDLGISMDAKADDGKLYKLVSAKDGRRPIFDTVHDTANGLRILINDVWAYEVRIIGYRKQYMSLFIEIEYTLYDHFGLDAPDIYKFDFEIFYVWFILQHFRGFKPLITQMKINREYPMIVPLDWE